MPVDHGRGGGGRVIEEQAPMLLRAGDGKRLKKRWGGEGSGLSVVVATTLL